MLIKIMRAMISLHLLQLHANAVRILRAKSTLNLLQPDADKNNKGEVRFRVIVI